MTFLAARNRKKSANFSLSNCPPVRTHPTNVLHSNLGRPLSQPLELTNQMTILGFESKTQRNLYQLKMKLFPFFVAGFTVSDLFYKTFITSITSDCSFSYFNSYRSLNRLVEYKLIFLCVMNLL